MSGVYPSQSDGARDARKNAMDFLENRSRQTRRGRSRIAQRGEFSQALAILESLLIHEPDQDDVRALYGWALFGSRPDDERIAREAVQQLTKSMGRDGRSPAAPYYLGCIYRQLGNARTARQLFRIGRSAFSSLPWASANRSTSGPASRNASHSPAGRTASSLDMGVSVQNSDRAIRPATCIGVKGRWSECACRASRRCLYSREFEARSRCRRDP